MYQQCYMEVWNMNYSYILLNLLGILAMTSHTAFFQLDIIQTGSVIAYV